ncbi:Uncharacterized protein SCF082_LOCUS52020 [Durusdinium trenchii]|uniref:Uncharacterized protein n=1 Tax=Durusdinium trenchii TaxID=1381693 RepID=A0ABP0SJ17_9DINO
MSTLIDSEAQIKSKAVEYRLSEDAQRALQRRGLVSLGAMAYAFGQPGQPINENEFNNWIHNEIVQNPSMSDTSALKRLLFESQLLVMAALKEQISAPDQTTPKKLPAVERETRMTAVRTALAGLLIEGPLEPVHHIILVVTVTWAVLKSPTVKAMEGESTMHKHKPRGLVFDKCGHHFATSEETAYPLQLAYQIENDLKESMPEHLRVILGPKRLLVWQKSLEEAGYPDLKVFQEMLNGTELTGEVPPCGIFEKSFKPCDITVEELKRIRYPKGAILSRRFGLKQPNKGQTCKGGLGMNGDSEDMPEAEDSPCGHCSADGGFRKRWAQKRKLAEVPQPIAEAEDVSDSAEPQELPNLGLEYEKTINAAFQRSRHEALKLPWEQGPFAFIFGADKSFHGALSKKPALSAFVPTSVPPQKSSSSPPDRDPARQKLDDLIPQPATSWCIRVTCSHEDAAQSAMEQRARAVGKWYKMVEEFPYASSTGLQILSMKSQGSQVSACKSSLDDVFGMKSVKILEEFACEAPGHYDRFAAGCLIMALLGRCRWSDFSWVECLDLSDPCFVEFGTSIHKTAGLMGKRNMSLPIIIPTRSLSKHHWFESWLCAAETLGLDLEKVPLGPVLPALDIKGHAVNVAVSSHEVTKLLNLILKPYNGQKISSHSLKATCLSWAAKAGMLLENREILGRHSRSSSTTSALYSRDLQGGALAAFEDMLEKITKGEFVPDAVRSARWPKAGSGPLIDLTIPEAEPEPVKHECTVAPIEGLDHEFDSENESEASSLGIVDLAPPDDEGPEPSGQFWTHNKSKIVHRKNDATVDHFLCGTKQSVHHIQISDEQRQIWLSCARCFREQHIGA